MVNKWLVVRNKGHDKQYLVDWRAMIISVMRDTGSLLINLRLKFLAPCPVVLPTLVHILDDFHM